MECNCSRANRLKQYNNISGSSETETRLRDVVKSTVCRRYGNKSESLSFFSGLASNLKEKITFSVKHENMKYKTLKKQPEVVK